MKEHVFTAIAALNAVISELCKENYSSSYVHNRLSEADRAIIKALEQELQRMKRDNEE